MERELYDMASKLPEMERTFADVQSRAPKKTQRNIWRRVAAVVTCFFLMAGVGLGTYAYTAEVKEYNAAIRFFCEYDLPTEGLTRGDIKAVYRDISTQTFHYSITEEVIENSLTPEQKTEYKELKDDQNAGNAVDLWEYKIQNAGSQPTIETTQPTKPTETTQPTKPTETIQPTQPTQSGVVTQSGMTFRILPEHPGGYTVTACEKTVSGELVIPETVNGLPVVAIAQDAFTDRRNLTSITIPDSVTYIGDGAFPYSYGAYSQLEYNRYDDAIYLGSAANPYIVLIDAVGQSITQCQIHPDTKFIYGAAFYNCTKLTEITIPQGVLHIGQRAFAECEKLKAITIPEGVLSLGESAFRGCKALTDISVPNSIAQFGLGVAFYCPEIEYNIYDNAKYIGNATNPYLVLVSAVSESITHCQIHPDTKFIHNQAFFECGKLENIVIPDAVISVGDAAFSRCNAVTDITIGKSVEKLFSDDDELNGYFPNLKGFWVSKDNPYYAGDEFGVLYDKSMTKVLQVPRALGGRYIVPDSVEILNFELFYQFRNFTHLTLGKGVSVIRKMDVDQIPANLVIRVADGNKHFETDSAGVLYERTLYYGRKLLFAPASLSGHYVIDGDVSGIGDGAFKYCDNLESVTIPKSVTKFGRLLFNLSGKLKTIHYAGTEAEWQRKTKGSGGFEGVTVICRDTGETLATEPTNPPKDVGERDRINSDTIWVCTVGVLLLGVCIGMIMYYMKKKKT